MLVAVVCIVALQREVAEVTFGIYRRGNDGKFDVVKESVEFGGEDFTVEVECDGGGHCFLLCFAAIVVVLLIFSYYRMIPYCQHECSQIVTKYSEVDISC